MLVDPERKDICVKCLIILVQTTTINIYAHEDETFISYIFAAVYACTITNVGLTE